MGDCTWARGGGGGGGIVECCDYFSGLHLTVVVIANKTRALVFDTLHSSHYFYHQFIKLSTIISFIAWTGVNRGQIA